MRWAQLKIKVNETEFDIEIFGDKAVIDDNREKTIEIKDDKIILEIKNFVLTFMMKRKRRIIINYKWDGFHGLQKIPGPTDN